MSAAQQPRCAICGRFISRDRHCPRVFDTDLGPEHE